MADDRGETLIEIIAAVSILGIAAVAIAGTMTISVKVSDYHRKESDAGAAARNYAEAIERYVAAAAPNYMNCAAANAYSPSAVGFTVAGGYSASQSAAQTWNGSSWVACTTDPGVQQVTVTVASADGRATENLTVILRRPCTAAAPC